MLCGYLNGLPLGGVMMGTRTGILVQALPLMGHTEDFSKPRRILVKYNREDPVFWVFLDLLVTCGIFIQRCIMERKAKLAYDIFRSFAKIHRSILSRSWTITVNIIFTTQIGENAVNTALLLSMESAGWLQGRPWKNVLGCRNISTDDTRVKGIGDSNWWRVGDCCDWTFKISKLK